MWAGLRPLVKSATSGRTADLSRRHRVTTGPAGMIAVAGGKLTTYREMAEDTVAAVLAALGRKARCRTKRLKLLGADGFTAPPEGSPAAHLAGRYGMLAAEVEALVAADAALGERLVPTLPYLRAEAVYAVRHEMATTLDDVLLRRTRAHLFDRPATLAAARRRRRAARRRARLGRRGDGRARSPRTAPSSPPRKPTPDDGGRARRAATAMTDADATDRAHRHGGALVRCGRRAGRRHRRAARADDRDRRRAARSPS